MGTCENFAALIFMLNGKALVYKFSKSHQLVSRNLNP